jgi:hypothetical protein
MENVTKHLEIVTVFFLGPILQIRRGELVTVGELKIHPHQGILNRPKVQEVVETLPLLGFDKIHEETWKKDVV